MPQPSELKVPLVLEAKRLHHPLRSQIGRQCPRADFGKAQPKANVQTSLSHLGGKALIPVVRENGVGKADDILTIDLVEL